MNRYELSDRESGIDEDDYGYGGEPGLGLSLVTCHESMDEIMSEPDYRDIVRQLTLRTM